MPEPAEAILILGGTAEANDLARRLRAARPGTRIVLSLAGRTRAPVLPENVEVRIGGFGGAGGLASFLAAERVGRMIDATHPFAAGISRNAAEAADRAGVARLVVMRPPWDAAPGDRWHVVDCLAAARDALPAKSRVFLALGRQHLAPFRHLSDIAFVTRMIEPPDPPLPFPAEILLGRPEPDVEAEAALLARLVVTHLVCRNSGGAASYAKVAAARKLGLPVIMIGRPPAPPGPLVASVGEALAYLGIDPSG
ncbi:cobalt-precorrin-6A reductase [Aurantimonas sp. VKM B-3413]|uniref:cobalt-precorrin-6A reductase n=1 Tax=Aurantimonas sp. VKM B-3413 TaxID=2779401 RepID=UPI001E4EDF72|nr:cobalt-precorrin-6A reductase [Aurantimonas sp. VKM B-3413]MCB8838648.1 cobalt-precorrin-6A reductase [Aurantimonas sp. VKM B-3413]